MTGNQESNPDCVFCRIAAGNIPGQIVYEDKRVVAFRDIKPAAPTHVLIIPRKHIESLASMSPEDSPLVADMVAAANRIARDEGIAERGYRIVINSGKEGGQVVPHLHMHLLGGRPMSGKLC